MATQGRLSGPITRSARRIKSHDRRFPKPVRLQAADRLLGQLSAIPLDLESSGGSRELTSADSDPISSRARCYCPREANRILRGAYATAKALRRHGT